MIKSFEVYTGTEWTPVTILQLEVLGRGFKPRVRLGTLDIKFVIGVQLTLRSLVVSVRLFVV